MCRLMSRAAAAASWARVMSPQAIANWASPVARWLHQSAVEPCGHCVDSIRQPWDAGNGLQPCAHGGLCEGYGPPAGRQPPQQTSGRLLCEALGPPPRAPIGSDEVRNT